MRIQEICDFLQRVAYMLDDWLYEPTVRRLHALTIHIIVFYQYSAAT